MSGARSRIHECRWTFGDESPRLVMLYNEASCCILFKFNATLCSQEALCYLSKIIGKTIDNPNNAQPYMIIYFGKIGVWRDDKLLSSQSRFMYKDLIEM